VRRSTGGTKEKGSVTARLISSGMVRSCLDDLGPGAKGYGNGNLERAYYNQGFTNAHHRRHEKRTKEF
jgi:hypothetical protein